MSYDGYSTKNSVVVVYTGEGKGKTSASLGLMARALGAGHRVAYIQFIKHWDVSEHNFIREVQGIYGDKLMLYIGGKGFYKAGDQSAKDVTETQHADEAVKTYKKAISSITSGDYDLVVCDEINNAVHDGLITEKDLLELIGKKHSTTSICITGRNFPLRFVRKADIVTNMTKLYHHYDDKYLANEGIDY